MKYQSSHFQKLLGRLKFKKKMSQTPRSRSQGKKQWYPQKGLFTENIHVKYQSSSTRSSKVISKVKVSERRQDKNNMPPPPPPATSGAKKKRNSFRKKYKQTSSSLLLATVGMKFAAILGVLAIQFSVISG